MLQHAKLLKLTLVIPDEKKAAHWTDMLDTSFDIWDKTSLNENYDIDWTSRIFMTPVALVIPHKCKVNEGQQQWLLKGGPALWGKWDIRCPGIIALNRQLPFCEKPRQFCGDSEAQMKAYQIYEHLKLFPSMQALLPSHHANNYQTTGYDQLAIHSRREGEGGYNWEICIRKKYGSMPLTCR